MKEINEFFNNMVESGSDFNKVKLGKVIDFDSETMKANIQPLPSQENSLLVNVPVMTFITGSFFIRLPLKKDDLVIVLFADNDLDNILLGSDNKATDRKHDLSDSICIGGIIPFTEEFTDEHEDDLIIANREATTKVVLKENGDIIIEGPKVFLGSGDAIEGVPLGDSLKDWLDNHTHPDVGPPTSQSPEPSKIVKVE